MKSSRIPLITTLAILLFFYLPIAVLVLDSFNASRFTGAWGGFSFKWYQKLFAEREIWEAVRNSLLVGVAATLVSTAIGTAAAFALHRFDTRLQRLDNVLIYTPLVVPEILMGISLLLLFIAIKTPLGLFTVFLAHVSFVISYVALVMLSRL